MSLAKAWLGDNTHCTVRGRAAILGPVLKDGPFTFSHMFTIGKGKTHDVPRGMIGQGSRWCKFERGGMDAPVRDGRACVLADLKVSMNGASAEAPEFSVRQPWSFG